VSPGHTQAATEHNLLDAPNAQASSIGPVPVLPNSTQSGTAKIAPPGLVLPAYCVQLATIAQLRAYGVRRMRLGHGANCSSIGSNVDLLFAGAAVAGALLAAAIARGEFAAPEPSTAAQPPAEDNAVPSAPEPAPAPEDVGMGAP
jgi:hypothetical protein